MYRCNLTKKPHLRHSAPKNNTVSRQAAGRCSSAGLYTYCM